MDSTARFSLHRTDTFVGRTMNWLYDHLRFLANPTPVVLCDRFENREEFPEVEAVARDREGLYGRILRKLSGNRFAPDLRWIRSHRPALIHSHFGYVAAGDFDLQRSLSVPWFVGFYGADIFMLPRSQEWVEIYGRLFEHITGALALGPYMERALIELGCPPDKVRVHPLGVDVSGIPFVTRHREAADTLRVLFAGTFREKKGLIYAIEACALARRAGVRLEFHVVGDAFDTAEKERMERATQQHGLTDDIVFHSWVSFERLLELALTSHVFVAPSVTADDGDSEGTPFVIQQMMATGIPVISTRHSDIPFLFGDSASLLVTERNAAEIASQLQGYYEEPERIVTIGTQLSEQVRSHFDVRARARSLTEIYDSLMARRSIPVN
jgi:colanic acid/amylovoran biosynthesis glycosyltransferase